MKRMVCTVVLGFVIVLGLVGCDLTHFYLRKPYAPPSDAYIARNMRYLYSQMAHRLYESRLDTRTVLYFTSIYPQDKDYEVLRTKMIESASGLGRFGYYRIEDLERSLDFFTQVDCAQVEISEQLKEIIAAQKIRYILFGTYKVLKNNVFVCLNVYDTTNDAIYLRYDYYFPIDVGVAQIISYDQKTIIPSVQTN